MSLMRRLALLKWAGRAGAWIVEDDYDSEFRYATRPLQQDRIRRLVVLKLWQARDSFDPAQLMEKFERGAEFDWDDLRDLVRRDARINRGKICTDCVRGFRFLANLTSEEQRLAADRHQREQALAEKLSEEMP